MTLNSTEMDRFVNKPNLTDEQVLAYLADHPKFFVNNSKILNLMEIPKRWQDDKVADMQSFLLDQRSHEIDELRDCAHEVIETSRSNLSVQTRTHAAILSLIGTSHLGQFIEVLNHDVPFYLDLDHISIGFEPFESPAFKPTPDGINSYKPGTVSAFIGTDKEIAIYPKIKSANIFFTSSPKIIASGALARINSSDHSPVGILALGSKESIFHPDQGTELINFLVRVIEILVYKYLGTNQND